jgi:molybdenum cofactor biosynthesis enzyme MoaA
MIFSRLSPVGFPFVKAFASNVLTSARGRHQPRKPMAVTYFVTFRCNLGCTYCEYANKCYAHRFPELDTAGAREVLRICREGSPSVAFTGGEPLLREDIVELVRYARKLRFNPISLFTNALLLSENQAVLNDVDYLQISLDTLDTDLQDRLCGQPGAGKSIVHNIVRYAALQHSKHFRLNINCVLSPATFGSVKDLLRFASETKVRLSILPQLDGDEQPSAFFRDPEMLRQHHAAIDTLLLSKPSEEVVFDTVPFLQHIRELKSDTCYPLLMPRVYPDGTLRYPCPNGCRSGYSLPKLGSWRQVQGTLEPVSAQCPAPCLSPCYLQATLLTRNPLVLWQEFRVGSL